MVSNKNRLPKGEGKIRQILRAYQYGAKKRGLPFELTEELFRDLISRPCAYCGLPPSQKFSKYDRKGKYSAYLNEWKDVLFSGVDRKDSNKGYTAENVVPCCTMCNVMKNKFDVDVFIRQARKIAEYRERTELRGEESSTASGGDRAA